jgi:hypothetical protein
MKTRIVLLSVLMIVAIGCEKDSSPYEEISLPEQQLSPLLNISITDYLPENSQYLKGVAVTRTIKFFEVTGTMVLDPGGTYPTLILGEGHASHMGHYTVKNTFGFYYGYPTYFGFLTAANGDEIRTVVIDSGPDPVYGIYLEYIVLGGTGRFEGITGTISMYGSMDLENLTWTLQGEGQVIY